MQISVSLVAGQMRRMEYAGRQFLIIASTAATSVAVKLKAGNDELEAVADAGRGFKARVGGPGFDVVELTAAADTTLKVVITWAELDFDFISGAAVTVSAPAGQPLLVSNDRGTPGNLLYVTGVSLTDAPATSTTTPAPVAVGAALVAVVAANASRRAMRIYNQGPDPATLGPAGHTWANRAVVIEAGQTFFEDRAANLATYAICEAGKAATLGIQEVIA